MGTTALKITNDGVEKRLLFMTVPTEHGVDVDLYEANEEFMPIGKASIGASDKHEIEYHVELRKEASKKGQFVPEFSTNPEYNPGYVEPTEEEL